MGGYVKDLMDVGLAMRFWRKAKGITQGQIAKMNQWERSYVSDLERGKIKNPGLDTVLQLISALGITANQFIEAGCGLLVIEDEGGDGGGTRKKKPSEEVKEVSKEGGTIPQE